MTKASRRCAWCGGVILDPGGPGRPRRYCRRSHRQRAFEARRAGAARALAADEAVVSASELAALRDHLYLLRATLEDTGEDLRSGGSAAEVRSAYEDLAAAARDLLRIRVSPAALGGPAPGTDEPSQ